jgi:hypothetical protein
MAPKAMRVVEISVTEEGGANTGTNPAHRLVQNGA